ATAPPRVRGRPQAMRWLLPLVLMACSHDMSDREYCTRRQMGWEMAFPTLPQSDADRTRFIDSCVASVATASRDDLAPSIAPKRPGHPNAHSRAFTRCEVVHPTRVH